MVRVKPFAAVRPPKKYVTEVSAQPYDVLNSEEARRTAGEKSLLHITNPEIDFTPIPRDDEPQVYDRAVRNFQAWQERGWLVQDPAERYYVYAQTMGSRTQYGIVLCAHTDDYASGKIKKHELTRKDKEDDRMVHVRIQNANIRLQGQRDARGHRLPDGRGRTGIRFHGRERLRPPVLAGRRGPERPDHRRFPR